MGTPISPEITQFVIIILAGVIGAQISEKINVPKVIPLVITGYILGPEVLGLFNPREVGLSFEVLVTLPIPILLFNEGMHIDTDYLRRYRWTIFLLATIGVVLTMGVVGFIAYRFVGLGLIPAFLLGSVLSATDPGVVISITRGLEVAKKSPITIVEAEAAFNDATSIVLTSLLVGLALGVPYTPLSAIVDFVRLFFGGMLIGFIIGVAAIEIIVRAGLRSHITYLSIVIFFTAYTVAEVLSTSGITSVVVAGIVTANYMERRLTLLERSKVDEIWEHLAFLSEALIFIFMGAYIDVGILASNLAPALIVLVAMMLLARPAAIYLSTVGASGITNRDRLFMTAVGARGAIPAALAGFLSSAGVPSSDVIFGIALSAVVVSLITVGLSAKPVAERTLGVRELSPWMERYYARLAYLHALRHSIRELDSIYRDGVVDLYVYNQLRRELESRYRELEEELGSIEEIPELRALREEELRRLRYRLLEVQINALAEMKERGILPTKVYNSVLRELRTQLSEVTEEEESRGAGFLEMIRRFVQRG